MKLKHLFFTVLLLGSLASCSDDNNSNGIEIPTEQTFEASLSIATAPKTGVSTKTVTDADPEKGTQPEDFINSLTALVYDEGGNLVASKTENAKDGKSVGTIENIIVKVKAEEVGTISSSKFKVYLFANLDVSAKSIVDLKAGHFEGISNYLFANVNAGTTQSAYLPMSSEEIEVKDLIAGTDYDNWYKSGAENPEYVLDVNNKIVDITDGKAEATDKVYTPEDNDKIELTRYVARIQLEELQTSFQGNQSGASFELTSISLANVSNASNYLGNDLSYVIGKGEKGAYNAEKAFYRGLPRSIVRKDYYLAKGTVSTDFLKAYSGVTIANNSNKLFTTGTTGDMAQFYAFEFAGYNIAKDDAADGVAGSVHTMLIIAGKIKDLAGVDPDVERYYRIPIKTTELEKSVKRNTIYKVSATITGIGSTNPDETLLNACVSFSIKVQPWKVINQTEEDVN